MAKAEKLDVIITGISGNQALLSSVKTPSLKNVATCLVKGEAQNIVEIVDDTV